MEPAAKVSVPPITSTIELPEQARRWTLRQQVVFGMLLLTAVVSVGAAKTLAYFETKYLTQTALQYGQETLKVLRASALEAIISEDQPVLAKLANELFRHDPRIHHILFINEKGKLLARAGTPGPISKDRSNPNMYSSRTSVSYLGENFGGIEIAWDLTSDYKKISEHAFVIGGLAALVLVVLTGLILAGLTFSVFRPIALLDRRLRGYSNGRWQCPVSMPRMASEEMNRLGHSVAMLGRAIRLNHQRTEELEAARQEAERANKAKSEFLANMSHDLRTPVNAIVGFSDMMKGELMGPMGNARYKEYVELIHNAGLHLAEIISDILDLAKVESGTVVLDEANVDVETLVHEAASLMTETAEKKGVHLSCSVPSGVSLRCDRRRLQQVLLNLIGNAVKFTPALGHVDTIVRTHAGGSLTIVVRDTGPGIAPEKIKTVLEPFGQVRSGPYEAAEGVGLGLPIAKSLVELHGASFEISSNGHKGTEVRLTFPPSRVGGGDGAIRDVELRAAAHR